MHNKIRIEQIGEAYEVQAYNLGRDMWGTIAYNGMTLFSKETADKVYAEMVEIYKQREAFQ